MYEQTPKETNHEIKTKGYIFSLVSDTTVEKSYFSCRVKIPYQQFLTFLSFTNIVKYSLSQMFFKIGTLKYFVIFWIKKSLQRRCFPMNIAKFFGATFLQNFSGSCSCIILKVFCSSYFAKTTFKEMSLLWCPNVFFFSTRFRETQHFM